LNATCEYRFPNDPTSQAVVPYQVRRDKTNISEPQKHTSGDLVKEQDLTPADIAFLSECRERAFNDLSKQGHTIGFN